MPPPTTTASINMMLRRFLLCVVALFLIFDAGGAFLPIRRMLSGNDMQLGWVTLSPYTIIKGGLLLLIVVLLLTDTAARAFLKALLSPSTAGMRWVAAIALLAILSLASAGWLDPIKLPLSSPKVTFQFGTYSISLYTFLKALIAMWALLWLASSIIALGEKRLKELKNVKTSNRALLIKGFQIVVYVLAFLFALNVLGIDVKALTVFGGALGIGLGFGLQKIAANFISGLILLFEKSVEEGDLVELDGGIYGFIKHTGARYTLIETLESKEIMVPNEDFISTRVTNWTFSDKKGRVDIPIGIAYESDIEKARDLMLAAVAAHPRCATSPQPKCFLQAFGESSVDFLIQFWVEDVDKGRLAPKSEIMFSIWEAFKENDIAIPFPQRDLHIKNPDALP